MFFANTSLLIRAHQTWFRKLLYDLYDFVVLSHIYLPILFIFQLFSTLLFLPPLLSGKRRWRILATATALPIGRDVRIRVATVTQQHGSVRLVNEELTPDRQSELPSFIVIKSHMSTRSFFSYSQHAEMGDNFSRRQVIQNGDCPQKSSLGCLLSNRILSWLLLADISSKYSWNLF